MECPNCKLSIANITTEGLAVIPVEVGTCPAVPAGRFVATPLASVAIKREAVTCDGTKGPRLVNPPALLNEPPFVKLPRFRK